MTDSIDRSRVVQRGNRYAALNLRDVVRVLAHWPRDRYLGPAPKYWAATRARLNPTELAAEIGDLTVPMPPAPTEISPAP